MRSRRNICHICIEIIILSMTLHEYDYLDGYHVNAKFIGHKLQTRTMLV